MTSLDKLITHGQSFCISETGHIKTTADKSSRVAVLYERKKNNGDVVVKNNETIVLDVIHAHANGHEKVNLFPYKNQTKMRRIIAAGNEYYPVTCNLRVHNVMESLNVKHLYYSAENQFTRNVREMDHLLDPILSSSSTLFRPLMDHEKGRRVAKAKQEIVDGLYKLDKYFHICLAHYILNNLDLSVEANMMKCLRHFKAIKKHPVFLKTIMTYLMILCMEHDWERFQEHQLIYQKIFAAIDFSV